MAGGMNKRIVFLRANAIAPCPRVEKPALALQQMGFGAQIVGWDRQGVGSEAARNAVPVTRLAIPSAFGSGIRNLVPLLRWHGALTRWLFANRREYDGIQACDLDTVVPALLAKTLLGKRVVYDIADFYVESRYIPRPLQAFVRRLEWWAMRRADAVILADESRRAQLGAVQPRRLEFIYNTPPALGRGGEKEKRRRGEEDSQSPIGSRQSVMDSSLITHHSSLSSPSTLNPQPSTLRIGFVGILSVVRGLEQLIEVVGRNCGWHLTLGGFGEDEARLKARAEGVANIDFLGRVEYARCLEIYEGVDAIVITYDPAIPNHRCSSPNKLFEAMMLGKPVVVAENTGMDALVRQYDLGLVVPYGDVAALERALAEIAGWDEAQKQAFAERARDTYRQHFSWELMESRLLSLYASVFNAHDTSVRSAIAAAR